MRSTSKATRFLGVAIVAALPATLAFASAERGSKSQQLTLLVAQREKVIEVIVGGVVLERLPLDDVALLSWQGGTKDATERPALDISGVLVVSGVPAVEVYPTIVAQASPAPDLPPPEPATASRDASAAAALSAELKLEKEEARAMPRRYDVELAGGARLEITTGRARPGWTTRWRDGWRHRNALRSGEAPPSDRLVISVERPVAERLLPMLRVGTRIVLGPATGAALPETEQKP